MECSALRDSRLARITDQIKEGMVMKKSNEINNLRIPYRQRRSAHRTDEMKEYVMDLWMSGTRPHVIERLVEKKLYEMLGERTTQKSA